ncbi:hypothetical protein Mapa_011395 [Marchantia paleacea]|nr:hypothetical protein Mapa_011395 [Marchantia paleacea]
MSLDLSIEVLLISPQCNRPIHLPRIHQSLPFLHNHHCIWDLPYDAHTFLQSMCPLVEIPSAL